MRGLSIKKHLFVGNFLQLVGNFLQKNQKFPTKSHRDFLYFFLKKSG